MKKYRGILKHQREKAPTRKTRWYDTKTAARAFLILMYHRHRREYVGEKIEYIIDSEGKVYNNV